MLYGTIPYSGVEFRCAVQSSALCDGIVALLVCSAGTVVAHFSIGLTEHRHRQSGAVRPSRDRLSRRQCMARPVCRRNVLRGTPGLHQCIRPRRLGRAAKMEIRARLLTRYTASEGSWLPTGLQNPDQLLGYLYVHPPADFMRPSSCRGAAAQPNSLPLAGDHGFVSALV